MTTATTLDPRGFNLDVYGESLTMDVKLEDRDKPRVGTIHVYPRGGRRSVKLNHCEEMGVDNPRDLPGFNGSAYTWVDPRPYAFIVLHAVALTNEPMHVKEARWERKRNLPLFVSGTEFRAFGVTFTCPEQTTKYSTADLEATR